MDSPTVAVLIFFSNTTNTEKWVRNFFNCLNCFIKVESSSWVRFHLQRNETCMTLKNIACLLGSVCGLLFWKLPLRMICLLLLQMF